MPVTPHLHDYEPEEIVHRSSGAATEYGSTTVDTVRQASSAANNSGHTLETISIRTEVIEACGYQRSDNDNREIFIGSFESLDLIAVPRRQRRAMDVQQQPPTGWALLRKGIALGLNVLAQVFIGLTAIYMTWFCVSRGFAGTSLHAWLVTIGFVCLMAEGVMVHYNANILTGHYKRDRRTRIHWMLQTFGGCLGMLGALIKCIQKGFLLYSLHGKLGFIASVLCLFTMLSGLSALYAMRVRELWSPLQNKTFHNCLGLSTFILAMLAQYHGYRTGYYERQVSHNMRLTMECATLVGLALCCVGPAKALAIKMKSLIRQFR